jgi:hypothetical protein
MLRLLLWKLYRFVTWFKAPSAKGVRLDDFRRWKETGEWSDKPPAGWPWRKT